ncbi:hypothetical protein AVEN_152373-1 [Araneus ventricosus]|uniref:PiggyBac transposable element-derived protein domain-containing protein n=1 Tax=Araneus ventricosus TaxID=182803 RepID=A0A4Y2DAY4_ARAVE|nr:hypothetical protein AVEN_152373-1 [Araneus ventricosus]
MFCLSGINLYMGIKKLPSYRDYWSTSPLLHDKYISKYLSVEQFSWLLAHIHLNDNSLQPPRGNEKYDKLCKVRPLTQNVFACGNVMMNRRNLPKTLLEDKILEEGEFDWAVSGENVVCMKWKDKRTVSVLLSQENPTAAASVDRREKMEEKEK